MRYLIIVLLGLISVASAKNRLPTYITYCHRNEPDLPGCFRNATEQIRPHLKMGIPEFGIPSLDPLVIPEAKITTESDLQADFRKIKIFYLDEFVMVDNINSLPENHCEVTLKFSKFKLQGEYGVNGKILFLQLNGSGFFELNATNVVGKMAMYGSRYFKNGHEYLKWDNKTLDFDLEAPVIYIDNPFRPDKEFTKQLNKIVNENVLVFMEELRPLISDTVKDFLGGIVDRIFSRFSLDDLHPI